VVFLRVPLNQDVCRAGLAYGASVALHHFDANVPGGVWQQNFGVDGLDGDGRHTFRLAPLYRLGCSICLSYALTRNFNSLSFIRTHTQVMHVDLAELVRDVVCVVCPFKLQVMKNYKLMLI